MRIPMHITGKRVKGANGELGPAENEMDNYYRCPSCGQSVDMRLLWQVFHHEEPDHKPIPEDA